jgi:hypothetical protein
MALESGWWVKGNLQLATRLDKRVESTVISLGKTPATTVHECHIPSVDTATLIELTGEGFEANFDGRDLCPQGLHRNGRVELLCSPLGYGNAGMQRTAKIRAA